MNTAYRVCTRCVMDTTDPAIMFDDNGVCNHCREFEQLAPDQWFPNEEGERRLAVLLERIKSAGRGQAYDCILGLSGGVDSSYLALRAHDWGLRPLVMHVDAGWNSELAVANIEAIVKHCGYHLHTHVVDWSEMRDLQLAYLRAGVANQDVPQDHAFFASMYHFAVKHRVKYVLSGGNLATEGIFPATWHGSAMDAANLLAIQRKFGRRRLKNYKTISFFEYYVWYPFVRGLRTLRPLNYMPYDKNVAIHELETTIGWRRYGRKHGESIFTRFFQNYYLPTKFGLDKRRPHLSSLIVSGQLSRQDAINMLAEPLYDPNELASDIKYLCKKLGIREEEFHQLFEAENHNYAEFRNWDRKRALLEKARDVVGRATGRRLKVYS